MSLKQVTTRARQDDDSNCRMFLGLSIKANRMSSRTAKVSLSAAELAVTDLSSSLSIVCSQDLELPSQDRDLKERATDFPSCRTSKENVRTRMEQEASLHQPYCGANTSTRWACSEIELSKMHTGAQERERTVQDSAVCAERQDSSKPFEQPYGHLLDANQLDSSSSASKTYGCTRIWPAGQSI